MLVCSNWDKTTFTIEAKDDEVAILQTQLDEKVVAQREAEQTLASYSEIENELKNLSERQEEKIREMGELVQLRDQEIAEQVASKDQLKAQLEETSESNVDIIHL